MTIEVLIATTDKTSIEEMELCNKNIDVPVLIINQTCSPKNYRHGKVRMLSFNERGLARSRNRAIENAEGDICVIADDDIRYKKGVFDQILEAFQKYPDADVITFQYEKENSLLNKRYSTRVFVHNRRTITHVSSIEIAFRLQSIRDKNIRFDERFGLGGEYVGGEENIFLLDCLRAGLKIYFIPLTIATHPNFSSSMTWNESIVMSKGALFCRMYGLLGPLCGVLFALKKYGKYKAEMSFLRFVFLIFKGIASFTRRYGICNTCGTQWS